MRNRPGPSPRRSAPRRRPESADALGFGLAAFLRGASVDEIVERDDGLLECTGGPQVYFAGPADWSELDRRALGHAHGRVLDVGAGAGRAALHLQSRGLDVTAIDDSPLAIRVCRRRGVKRAILRPIADIGRFRARAFDTIVMLGNNFGLFGSRAGARRLLRAMHRITSDGAVIVAQSLDPYATKDPVHRAYHRRNLARGRMAGQIRLRVRVRDRVGPWFDYLFVSRDELRAIVTGTGWHVREFLDADGPIYAAVLAKDAPPR